jgi:hypothetical protein
MPLPKLIKISVLVFLFGVNEFTRIRRDIKFQPLKPHRTH